MISRADVFSGYRMILGREPEDEGIITYHRQHENLSAFRRALLAPEEFNQLHFQTRGESDIPFPDWEDLSTPRVVFMHSPKTGGTTLHSLLAGHFQENLICPERFNGIRNYPTGELAKYRLFSGHYDLASCHLIPGQKRIVTLLRDPVSRLVSLYNFLKAHQPDVVERNNWGLARLAAVLDAEEFFLHPVTRSHPYIENGLTRALAGSLSLDIWPTIDESAPAVSVADAGERALDHLSGLAAFGILERYEESVELIFDSLELPQPAAISRKMELSELMNETSNYRSIDIVHESSQLRSIIEELVHVDLELYQRALKIFDSRCQASVRR